MWFLFSLVFTVLLIVYYFGTRTYGYWKKKGVPYVTAKYPFLGTSYKVAFSFVPVHIRQQEYYNHYFKGKPFGGIFSFTSPVLFLRDPGLIENILIKDFNSFYNRGLGADLELDPLSAHLVNLEDLKWKSLRQKLTPTFSSGKLKGMHQQLIDCSDALITYIGKYEERSEPVEIRDVMSKFSTDVIGSCVLGLNMNSISDDESEFKRIGRLVFQPTFKKRLRATIRLVYPGLLSLLKWKNLPTYIEQFFTKMLLSTMSYRENNNIIRNDFVQLLMELKQHDRERVLEGDPDADGQIIIDDKIVVANAFVFFLAGFETTASTLSFCLYELSLNQEIQEQAYNHVVSVLKKHGGEITYDAVRDMTFINQIFAETLRLHPPAPEMQRKATKDYIVPGTNVTLPKGLAVTIPIYSVHRDPQHFPEPEKFLPERFKDEKGSIKKGTYLPFGDGPRICIGKRFAEMEMHVALVKLLLKYKFTLNEKTISPMCFSPSSIFMVPVGGIWLDLHKRV